MITLRVRNVNEALPLAMGMIRRDGVERKSRNGNVTVIPMPVTTLYDNPCERVLFHPERDANPFFHLMESLWMLAGRNDVEWISQYVKRMSMFSDDGEILHGAYGHRWRNHFSMDQIRQAINRLTINRHDRRVVIGMWDPFADDPMVDGGKDVPCNLTIKFMRNNHDCLDMIVFNRSNDMVWGAYGANVVHMSVLQEYIAANVGVPVGRYWQVSCDFHIYEDQLEKLSNVSTRTMDLYDPYCYDVKFEPLIKNPEQFDSELHQFMASACSIRRSNYKEPFFRNIAMPMYRSHLAYKAHQREEKYTKALELIEDMPDCNDWKIACKEWIHRRWTNYRIANDDGVSYEK